MSYGHELILISHLRRGYLLGKGGSSKGVREVGFKEVFGKDYSMRNGAECSSQRCKFPLSFVLDECTFLCVILPPRSRRELRSSGLLRSE